MKSSCGCAVASVSTKELKPGESATLKVELDTKRKGKMSRSITVMSNDPNDPNKILTLFADIGLKEKLCRGLEDLKTILH